MVVLKYHNGNARNESKKGLTIFGYLIHGLEMLSWLKRCPQSYKSLPFDTFAPQKFATRTQRNHFIIPSCLKHPPIRRLVQRLSSSYRTSFAIKSAERSSLTKSKIKARRPNLLPVSLHTSPLSAVRNIEPLLESLGLHDRIFRRNPNLVSYRRSTSLHLHIWRKGKDLSNHCTWSIASPIAPPKATRTRRSPYSIITPWDQLDLSKL